MYRGLAEKWRNEPSYPLAFSWCINSLAYSIVYPFIPLYLHSERQIPMSTVGLIFPVMGAGIMLGPPAAGWLVDRLGRKIILFHGSTARGVVFMILTLMALFDAAFWMFCVAMFFNAFVGTFFQNASDAYLTDVTSEAERPRAYSRIRVGTNVGWALGPIIGSFLARTPFSFLFMVTALLCFSGAGFISACLRDPEKVIHSSCSGEPHRTFAWKDLHLVYLLMIFFNFILFMLISQLYTTLSVFSSDVVGITRNHLGLVYSVNGIVIVFFQLPATRILDKCQTSGFTRMIVGAAMYGAGYFAVAFCRGATGLATAVLVITFGEIFLQPAIYTAISRMAPRHCIGRFMGFFGLMRGLGYAIGPYLGGLLFESYSGRPVMLWGVLSAVALISIIGFFIIRFMAEKLGYAHTLR